MDIFKKLEDSGVDVKDFLHKHVIMELLPDVLEQIALSIKSDYAKAGIYGKDIKQSIERIIKPSERYVKLWHSRYAKHDLKTSEQYGDMADKFLVELEKLILDKEFYTLDDG